MGLDDLAYSAVLVSMALCALLSIYGIVGRRSLTKKLISLTILSDTSFVLYILIGYRFVHPSVPPIYTEYSQGYVAYLSRHAVDPLPQALVLTGVVIGMAVNALIAFGIIQAYRLCGTTDAKLLVEATKREAGVE